MRNMGVWEYHVSAAATIFLVILVCSNEIAKVLSQSQNVSAVFVFGDSLVDVGNNNFLLTFAKANFRPYGIDFSQGPTGRFSNGKCFVDLLGEKLGVPSPPAFQDLNTFGDRILNGVNYASASSGILDESRRLYGRRYSMNQQVSYFENTLSQYRTTMNETTLNQFLAKSLAVVVTGNNDYLANYLLPYLHGSRPGYTPQKFGKLLVDSLERQILTLHSLGLRKFFIAGVGPIGCIPYIRVNFAAPHQRCVDFVNQMVGIFNEELRSMVDQLNKNHPNAIFVHGNTYRTLADILNNPAKYGFSFTDTACCGLGIDRGQISCLPFLFPCENRRQYVFWDAFHPTESTVEICAQRALHGNPDDVYPVNLQRMALM